jgi:hypothetical protein
LILVKDLAEHGKLQEVHGQRMSFHWAYIDRGLMVYQPLKIFVDDKTKLTLHGLQQHYIELEETRKNRKLNELLDSLEFNQVCTLSTSKERDGNLEIGRHLCEIRGTGKRARQASGFVQLPKYQYPFRACAGGAVCAH